METLNLGIDGLDQIELIGRGGSSRVYRARQIELDRMVALKVLNASDDSDVVRRFDRERKAMGRLSENEGIVPVYSTGVTDNGEPYLLMPYYVQGSLQDRLETGPVPWPEAVDYVVAVAKTVAAAHQSGVVHLDLKPANILLSANGSPRIADFGIAKLMSEQGGVTKNTGAAFTPTFSAPEALLGEATSPASDVYGLGATLWALIAGRPPFRDLNGDNALMAVVGRVVHQPVPDLREKAPDAVCAVIEMAMAKRPADRYPTAGTFAQALVEAAADARRLPADPTGTGTGGNGHRPPTGPTPPVSGRTHLEQAPAGGVFAADRGQPGRIPPSRFADDNPPTAVMAAPSRAGGRLLDDAVPPPFVPVAPAEYDDTGEPSRATMAVLAGGAVILVIVALITVVTLLRADSGDATTPTSPTAATGPGASGSVGDGAVAGASQDTAVAGPTTVSTTGDSQSLVTPTGSSTTTSDTGTATSLDTTSSSTPASSSPSSGPSTSGPATTPTSGTVTTPTSRATTGSTTPTSATSTPTSTPTSPPTTAPLDPPTGVTAERVTGLLEIQVSWTPPADANGIAGYTVERTTAAGAVTRFDVSGARARTYADSNLVAGQIYTYRVRARGAGTAPAVSAWSGPTAPIEVADP